MSQILRRFAVFAPVGARPLRAPQLTAIAACSLLLCAAAAMLSACGSGLGTLPASGGRRIDGVVAFRPIPTTESLPSFAPLTVSFVAWEALTEPNALVPLSAAQAVPALSDTCAASGCPYTATDVDTSSASKGAFALFASSAGASGPYVPTASLALDVNQLADNRGNKVGLSPQGHASVLTPAGVQKLAKLANLTGEQLLARGFAIGIVAQNRVYPSGSVPGVAQALVTLAGEAGGAELFYPNDAWDAVQTSGTNAAGAFVVVGPATPPPAGAGLAVAVTIEAATSLSHWPTQPILLRPALAVVMPMLPAP